MHRQSGSVSDFAGFMDNFLQRGPEMHENRRRGWRIDWERPVNVPALERTMADTVP
ncbi:DUF3460 family protein [Janthinobacterium sp. PC23-8]|uniref:DUF3460 family protein n=1 Tax=Janthinobacterium sp. PC23-8 TaxID=2012679 RepID=UPI0011407AD9|nr:DUF3460 family protein [Janthinobacterium sp. PC23-8]